MSKPRTIDPRIERQVYVLKTPEGHSEVNVLTADPVNGRYTGKVGEVDSNGNVVLDINELLARGLRPEEIADDVETVLRNKLTGGKGVERR